MPVLSGLETPLLLLDEARMQRNIARMQSRMDALGVRFRPHVKTSKCPEVVRRQIAAGARGITVSTLKEAERFLAEGVTDALYAVAIVPAKFDHALRLSRQGLRLTLLVESVAAAEALSRHGVEHGHCHAVLIEIDTDGHRSGVRPDDPLLLAVAAALTTEGGCGARLEGVMTHAGGSYALHAPDALAAMAEQERSRCVAAAMRLRAAGYPCPTVSVGSTPTALSARSLEGVTEVRAGVYVFFDLVMSGIGVCTRDEIALSVLCTVIGHRPDAGWVITDAGWMAMSRDRGTRTQERDFGYGAGLRRRGQRSPRTRVSRRQPGARGAALDRRQRRGPGAALSGGLAASHRAQPCVRHGRAVRRLCRAVGLRTARAVAALQRVVIERMGSALRAGVVYFVVVFAAGFVLGVLRTLFVAPRIGVLAAVAVELPIVLAVAWWVSARLQRGSSLTSRDAALMGGTAFALLMLAEASLSIALFGRTIAEHLSLYADADHQLGLAGQIAFALIPMVQVRHRWREGSR